MSNEVTCLTPTVRINGSDVSDVVCLKVEESAGITPGRARLRYLPSRDTSSPVTLQTVSYKFGSRVVIYDDSTSKIFFHGWLKKRSDSGSADTILLEAVSDQWLLSKIPVRGCLIRDADGVLRFSSRHPTRMNPDGAWNCTGIDLGGTTYPVFTNTGYYARAYESPTDAFDGTVLPTDGTHAPWTPRRALAYLRLWMYVCDINGGTFPECLTGDMCNPLKMSGTGCALTWDASTVSGLYGLDAGGSGVDPLDRKLADVTMQGDNARRALDKILQEAGTHDLVIHYDDTTINAGLSKIEFEPVGYSSTEGASITLQRAGTADTSEGDVVDFVVDEDCEDAFNVVFVEGDVSKVEMRVSWEGTRATDGLVPAWTADEETAFLRIINGALPPDVGETYAVIPETQSETTTFLACDGTGGRPLAFARSQQAIAIARECYPTVFRAWKINANNTDVSTALKSPTYSCGYHLKADRPILPEQLQFYLRDINGGTGDDNWLRMQLPIRAEVQFNGEWFDVPRDVAVRVTDDNLIWLDGLAEAANATQYCAYSGNLEDYLDYVNESISSRAIRLNVAMPTDFRTIGWKNETLSWLSSDVEGAFSGGWLMQHVDVPGAYRENYQYKSYPSANPKFYAGSTGTAAPLSRQVPPGSEYKHAEYAADRRIMRARNIRRNTTWSRVGIHTSVRAGDWLERVYLRDPVTPLYTQYEIDAAIQTVTWDFEKQVTTIGGLLSEYV